LLATAELRADTQSPSESSVVKLDFAALPDLPNELGVAGPFVGVHGEALVVAGGANFARPVWENDKQWVDEIHVLTPSSDGYQWLDGGRLPRPLAYGVSISTPEGIVCLGGNDAQNTFDEAHLLVWNSQTKAIEQQPLARLPAPVAYAAAAKIGDAIYLVGGQHGSDLLTATANCWRLDWSPQKPPAERTWEVLPPGPAPSRAFHMVVAQHNGYDDCLYVMSGRRQQGEQVEFLVDNWEYNPRTKLWRRRADLPRCATAGTAAPWGQSHLFVLGGADGTLFARADELRDNHPGFPKSALAYHTITDRWTSAGPIPQNQVTTTAVRWGDRIVVASGEIRPRVRTPSVWSIAPQASSRAFGYLNYAVLFSYLLAMVGIGLYCNRKNRSTDDFFRGGKQIPWWAAGCSIFATMLSSLTFTGIPAKAFAQDWVYAVGNLMIPLVALLAVFVALPFYRRLDVTSAYEYLELRFSRSVRLFGSVSFALFHLFRMAVVMSLTALALAVATPLTPLESVLIMGILSIAYCTIGGIEAVIWTDTVQTVVLFGGAVVALYLLISGTTGESAFSFALDAEKLRIANFHGDATSAQLALWVVILGGIGQQTSSYTADQAVVQRYMTTSTQQLAARSIWTNAVLTVPATFLFFGIGTALFAYYRAHPGRLDPTITTDQIFPYFIATEMPIGLSGLVVAAIFAAAQSTVSTSMNSVATTTITDLLRPLWPQAAEATFLAAARWATLLAGVVGTVLALLFIDPSIKSLFDAFIQVVGVFMGVLGGLFVLGVFFPRATAGGALTGAIVGAATMLVTWHYHLVNGYLFTTIGIATCVLVGMVASLFTRPGPQVDQQLTVFGR
jgi:SSS family transporter